MSHPAAERWDRRYRETEEHSRFLDPRPFLTENSVHLPSSGRALDAAAGLGNNAAFLINRGIEVVGVDISGVGIRKARTRLPALLAVKADLTEITFPSGCFDVILNFYYLERDLFHSYLTWLRPGGLLFFETLTRDMLQIKPDLNPEFLLRSGELMEAFSSWEVLEYKEGWQSARNGRQKATASLLARRPNKP